MKTKRIQFTVQVTLDIPESKLSDEMNDLYFGDFLLHKNLSSHLDHGVELVDYQTTEVYVHEDKEVSS